MTKKQNYILRQRLVGLGCILLSIVATVVFHGLPAYLVLGPIGLLLLFTKDRILDESGYYYDDVEDEDESW